MKEVLDFLPQMFIVYSVFISKAYEKPPFFEIRTGLRGGLLA
jgi:hypothetical protein